MATPSPSIRSRRVCGVRSRASDSRAVYYILYIFHIRRRGPRRATDEWRRHACPSPASILHLRCNAIAQKISESHVGSRSLGRSRTGKQDTRSLRAARGAPHATIGRSRRVRDGSAGRAPCGVGVSVAPAAFAWRWSAWSGVVSYSRASRSISWTCGIVGGSRRGAASGGEGWRRGGEGARSRVGVAGRHRCGWHRAKLAHPAHFL